MVCVPAILADAVRSRLEVSRRLAPSLAAGGAWAQMVAPLANMAEAALAGGLAAVSRTGLPWWTSRAGRTGVGAHTGATRQASATVYPTDHRLVSD